LAASSRVYERAGCESNYMEALPRILASVDEDVLRFFNQTLKRRGVEVRTGAMVKAIRKEGDKLSVTWDAAGTEQSAIGQYVLIGDRARPVLRRTWNRRMRFKTLTTLRCS